MTDLDRLKIAFDLLYLQWQGVAKQLEAEREKNAKLIAQMGAATEDGRDQVVSISR